MVARKEDHPKEILSLSLFVQSKQSAPSLWRQWPIAWSALKNPYGFPKMNDPDVLLSQIRNLPVSATTNWLERSVNMKKSFSLVPALPIAAFVLLISQAAMAQATGQDWPKRVLITNDNGIADTKMIQLAQAFAKVAETYVAAPLQDRSGTSHSVTQKRKFDVERRELGEGIVAYGIDGTPAECILFGLQGLLRDKQPDLVISGVNGGENAGMEWLFSGTIGAARMATVLGVPAIAVSGLSSQHPQNYPVVMQWVVELARSKIVRELKPSQYLAVSIPRVKFSEIKGVDVTSRPFIAMGVQAKTFNSQNTSPKRETWEFENYAYRGSIPADSDLASYKANRIAIVLMRADENDYENIGEFKKRLSEIPGWPSGSSSEKKSP